MYQKASNTNDLRGIELEFWIIYLLKSLKTIFKLKKVNCHTKISAAHAFVNLRRFAFFH